MTSGLRRLWRRLVLALALGLAALGAVAQGDPGFIGPPAPPDLAVLMSRSRGTISTSTGSASCIPATVAVEV